MTSGLAPILIESRGAPSAFGEVYARQARPVLAYFTRRTFDVDVAKDLTAETFAQAFASRRKFRGTTDAEAEAWLYGIARHLLSRYTRRGVVERRAVQRLGVRVPTVTTEDEQRILELAGIDDMRGRVAEAFACLPAPQREALRLRVIDERDYSDVAALLGVSEQTARSRVSRGLQRLAGVADIAPVAGR